MNDMYEDLFDEYFTKRSDILNLGKRLAISRNRKVLPHLRHYPSGLGYVKQNIPNEVETFGLCERKIILSILGFPTPPSSKTSIEHFYRGHIVAMGESEALRHVLQKDAIPKDELDHIPSLKQLVDEGWTVIDDNSDPQKLSFTGKMEDCQFVDSGRFDQILTPDGNPMSANAIVEELKAPNDGNFKSYRTLAGAYYLQASTYCYHHPSGRCGLCARSGSTEHYQYWVTKFDRANRIFRSRKVAGISLKTPEEVCVSLDGLVESRKHVEKMVIGFLTESNFQKLTYLPSPKNMDSGKYPCSWGKDKTSGDNTAFCEYYDFCFQMYPLEEWRKGNMLEAQKMLDEVMKERTTNAG